MKNILLTLMVFGIVGCSQENTILKLDCIDTTKNSEPVSIEINKATMEWNWFFYREQSGKITKANDQYYVFGVLARDKWRDFYYINRSTLRVYVAPHSTYQEEDDRYVLSLEKLPSYESASIEQGTYWASCEVATQKI